MWSKRMLMSMWTLLCVSGAAGWNNSSWAKAPNSRPEVQTYVGTRLTKSVTGEALYNSPLALKIEVDRDAKVIREFLYIPGGKFGIKSVSKSVRPIPGSDFYKVKIENLPGKGLARVHGSEGPTSDGESPSWMWESPDRWAGKSWSWDLKIGLNLLRVVGQAYFTDEGIRVEASFLNFRDRVIGEYTEVYRQASAREYESLRQAILKDEINDKILNHLPRVEAAQSPDQTM